jgi:EmrB/QacA subfamily drug resistance transporter
MTATQPPSRLHWLPFIVAATFFMEYLDTTIIATALPQMAQTFKVGPNELSLGMTAYMLTLAVFIPISGWIADRLGSRSVFAAAIVIFTLASVLCGLSGNVLEFTAARILQGMGGALMVPVGRLIVVRNTSQDKLMKAISMITWPAIVAPVVGPALGGFITTYFSWHWIFLINVPFGITALIAVLSLVPNERSSEKRPLDMVGFFISGTALTTLLYGTELASHNETNLAVAILFIVIGLILGVVSYQHGMRSAHPLLDYSTFKIKSFHITIVTGAFTRIGIEAVPYLLPLLFQIGFGLSAFQSGMLLLASASGNLLMKVFTTRVLQRYGFRNVSLINCALAGVFVIACGLLTPGTPVLVVLVTIFIYGLARSMQFSTLATLAYADVGPQQKSAASTIWSVAQQMTIGMGIASGALGLRIASHFSGSAAQGAGESHFSMTDFHWAFILCGLITLGSTWGYRALAKDTGKNLGGGVGTGQGALPSSRR